MVMPSAGRVRVQIAGKELPSLARGIDKPWSGIVSGVSTKCEKTPFGRTENEDFGVTVDLAAVVGGFPPDNDRVGIMYPGESTFTTWRATGSHRRANTMLTIHLGPLNG